MDNLLNEKYKPQDLENFYLNESNKKIIKFFFKKNNIKLLIIGNNCSGKTTLTNVLINKYFYFNNNIKDSNIKDNNLLYISSLKDNGINYFRNEIKIFCQSNKLVNIKKLIVIDDLENINDQCQYILLGLINKFKDKINIIITVNNYQKILDGFISHLNIINLEYPDYDYLYNYTYKIITKENINIEKILIDKIIINSNNSIKNIINILEKFILYNDKINEDNINNFLYFINNKIFYNFTNYCLDNNFNDALLCLLDIYNNGYSLIDIYESYSNYIKNTFDFKENIKFKIIDILIDFIISYHNINENKLEIYFFVNKIINIINN